MTPYIIFRLIMALVTGAVFYVIDRQGGTSLYRWWYGMTHEHPLPENVRRGFVHNRATKARVIAATFLASIISVLGITYGGQNALLELLLWLLSIPVIVLAFMVGPRIAALWGKRDEVFQAVDKWEGNTDASDRTIKPTAETPPLAAPTEREAHIVEPPNQEPVVEQPIAGPSQPEPKAETDPQEMVNRFINRGKS